MRVVLIKNVENLGIVGDEKEVKTGYARNWLLPQKMAVYAFDPKAKKIIARAKEERAKIAKEIERLKTLAKDMEAKIIEIEAKSGEKGKLFGSVTNDDIARKLKIDKKSIEMKPIREAGMHEILIKLGYGVEARVKINVVATAEKNRQ